MAVRRLNLEIFSDKIDVKWNEKSKILCINSNGKDSGNNLINIKYETLKKMSFKEACEFVGGDILLLIPAIRRLYAEELQISEEQIGDNPKSSE